MALIWLQRRGQFFHPASAREASQVESVPEGVALRAEIKRPRNGKHHRLIWALFTSVADALNDGPVPTPAPWTPEKVAELCKLATGHADKRLATARECAANGVPKGSYVVIPASISYAAMDETAFARFAQAAVDWIAADLCPWWRASESADGVLDLLRTYGVDLREGAA